MQIKEFDYYLPKSLIAQKPICPRDHSRLLVLNRESCHSALDAESINNIDSCLRRNDIFIHDHFYNIGEYFKKGDVVVLNDSKVIPARLTTDKGKEVFLLRELKNGEWLCLTYCKGRTFVIFAGSNLRGRIIEECGQKVIYFNRRDRALWSIIEKIGEVPTPPYIVRNRRGRLRTKEFGSSRFETSNSKLRELFQENRYYQTVYAKKKGSVAAPTAGFHFTQKLINKLKDQGVKFVFVTLHVGLGTFAPIRAERVEDHQMHAEWFELNKKTGEILNKAKNDGRRIIAVGTTAARVLESCAFTPPSPAYKPNYYLKPQSGETKIFIKPGYKFKFVDALITNFHLPRSTPLLLASAFVENGCHSRLDRESINKMDPRFCGDDNTGNGVKILLQTYQEAIKKKYRFYSFGDAMMIV